MQKSNSSTNATDCLVRVTVLWDKLAQVESKRLYHYQFIAYLMSAAWLSTMVMALTGGYDSEDAWSVATVVLVITTAILAVIHLYRARCARLQLDEISKELR